MSARPTTAAAAALDRSRQRHRLRAERPAARRSTLDRPGPDRRTGRRHPRSRRQSLWRHRATATSSASSRPTTSGWKSSPISAATPLGMAFDRQDNLYVCIGGMGLYQVTPDRKVEKADRRNQPQLTLDHRRLAGCGWPTTSTSPPTAASSSREATIRYEMHDWATDALEARGNGRIICYDPKTGKTHTVLRDLQFPNGVCIAQRRAVVPVRRDLGLPHQALLVRRPEEGHDARSVHRQPAGLSRQHQPRVRRQLLGGAGRHALPGARPGAGRCRASASAWPSAWPRDEWLYPEHQHRLRAEVQREGRDARDALGPRRRRTIR